MERKLCCILNPWAACQYCGEKFCETCHKSRYAKDRSHIVSEMPKCTDLANSGWRHSIDRHKLVK